MAASDRPPKKRYKLCRLDIVPHIFVNVDKKYLRIHGQNRSWVHMSEFSHDTTSHVLEIIVRYNRKHYSFQGENPGHCIVPNYGRAFVSQRWSVAPVELKEGRWEVQIREDVPDAMSIERSNTTPYVR